MNKIFNLTIFTIIAVLISSCVPLSVGDIWYGQYLTLLFLMFFGISLLFWDFNKWLSLFTINCLFSTFFVAGQHPRAFICLITIYLACLVVYTISRFTHKQRVWLVRTLGVLIFLNGVWVIVQYLNIDPIFKNITDDPIYRTVGLVGSKNQSGLLFASTAGVAMYMPWLLPLAIFGLWCSTTSSAWVGFVAGCLSYLLIRNRKFFVLVLVLLSVCSFVFFTKFEGLTMGMIEERGGLYLHTIESVETGEVVMKQKMKDGTLYRKVKCNPWFGYGLGNFIRISPYTQDFMNRRWAHRYSHAHNDLLEAYYEMGRVGLGVSLLLILNFFYLFIRAKKTRLLTVSFCCVLAHLVTSMGIFTVQTAVSGMLLIISLGIFYGEIRSQKGVKIDCS